jgi:hypothetical protein
VGALCVDGVGKESFAARHVTTTDHSRTSISTPNIAKNGMSVSRLKKFGCLEAALSRVEEEARGIGKGLAMVEKVVGTGGGLQEVGTRATGIGTIEEVLGLMEEAVGDPVGTRARHVVTSGRLISQTYQDLVGLLFLHTDQKLQMVQTAVVTRDSDQQFDKQILHRLSTTSTKKKDPASLYRSQVHLD